MTMQAAYDTTVNALYLAFYGRPADPAGLSYWSGQLAAADGDASAIVNAFAASDEATARFGTETATQRVTDMYEQLFNRAPDAAGLAYWSDAVANGGVSLASVAMTMLAGAQGADHTLADLRLQAMASFTAQVAASGTDYSGYAAITAAAVLVRAVTLESSAADIDALVKAVVSFADTATNTPAVVAAIATGSTLAALYDTTRGAADPVSLTQALADTAKAAAGNPETLAELLRGGGMAQVLKVMPADATLHDVVVALAAGGLAAAIEVVYPTPAPVAPFSLHLAFKSVEEGAYDTHHDNVTNVAAADVVFKYTGANLTGGQHFEYSLDGTTWITTGIVASTADKTVTLHDIDLSAGAAPILSFQSGVHVFNVVSVPDLTSTVYLRAADASGAHTTAVSQAIVYDSQAPLGSFGFSAVQGALVDAPTQTALATADVVFDYSDTPAAGDSFQVSLDDGAWSAVAGNAWNATTHLLTIAGVDFTAADHTVNVRPVDAAGNVGHADSQFIDSTANAPVEPEASTLTSVHSPVAASSDPGVLVLGTDGYAIVSASGGDSQDGFADKDSFMFVSAANLSGADAIDYLAGAHLDGNVLTLGATPALDAYSFASQSNTFHTDGPSGQGYVATSSFVVTGGVDGGLTVVSVGVNFTHLVAVDEVSTLHNAESATYAYVVYDQDARIQTGTGADLVISQGNSNTTMVYNTLASTGPDLIMNFASVHIELDGAAAFQVDSNLSGTIAWGAQTGDTRYVVAAGTEAVQINTTGALVIGSGAQDIATTAATLNGALNVSGLAQGAGVLVLANDADHSVLFWVSDQGHDGTIGADDYSVIAVVGNGMLEQADVQVVGSAIPLPPLPFMPD